MALATVIADGPATTLQPATEAGTAWRLRPSHKGRRKRPNSGQDTMRIAPLLPALRLRQQRAAAVPVGAPGAPPSTSPVAPVSGASLARTGQRSLAPFIAHLIAVRARLPQTRARRRCEPSQAAKAYAEALRLVPTEEARAARRAYGSTRSTV